MSSARPPEESRQACEASRGALAAFCPAGQDGNRRKHRASAASARPRLAAPGQCNDQALPRSGKLSARAPARFRAAALSRPLERNQPRANPTQLVAPVPRCPRRARPHGLPVAALPRTSRVFLMALLRRMRPNDTRGEGHGPNATPQSVASLRAEACGLAWPPAPSLRCAPRASLRVAFVARGCRAAPSRLPARGRPPERRAAAPPLATRSAGFVEAGWSPCGRRGCQRRDRLPLVPRLACLDALQPQLRRLTRTRLALQAPRRHDATWRRVCGLPAAERARG